MFFAFTVIIVYAFAVALRQILDGEDLRTERGDRSAIVADLVVQSDSPTSLHFDAVVFKSTVFCPQWLWLQVSVLAVLVFLVGLGEPNSQSLAAG